MAVIHVLDKHTAELIAAGEVVERPASVVKELLENAIDAGASQITVTIESGGVKLIEISDNGSGIEAEYIPTAFIRHATSKIRTEDDLNHIHTLGFRGEALASIASVARVEVLTRTENDECASVYRIEGGEDYPLEPGARGVGTTIRVQDLFYNTPARMKFLKKDASEGTFVSETVLHAALSHPDQTALRLRDHRVVELAQGAADLAAQPPDEQACIGQKQGQEQKPDHPGLVVVSEIVGLIPESLPQKQGHALPLAVVKGGALKKAVGIAGAGEQLVFPGSIAGFSIL